MSAHNPRFRPSRRGLLKGLGLGSSALAFPHVFIPRAAYAQTAARGSVKHVIYVRLAGGFRFTAAFNGDVAAEFNPFGKGAKAPGTEWSPSRLLERATFLDGDAGEARRALGMRAVSEMSNEMVLLPCVDHEPSSARADGNHGTGLERFLTGYVGGSNSFFTMVNYGLRARAAEPGKTLLPAFSLGEAGMSIGSGIHAAFRAPVLDGEGFERFSFDSTASLPGWAKEMASRADERLRGRLHGAWRGRVEAYQQTRQDAQAYGRVFNDDLLKVGNRSDQQVDGISNRELETIFGTDRTGRRLALALRLFHFGSPAVFLNQGGYDMHSQEELDLPVELEQCNRVVSGLAAALKRMQHPSGGTYWDKTVVAFGSEFGRTTGGSRFNSAGGSDHSSDYATRWMSMPMMGGPLARVGGRSFGQTRASDLRAVGKVYSYRSVLKTLLDLLGADHSEFFQADAPIGDLFV